MFSTYRHAAVITASHRIAKDCVIAASTSPDESPLSRAYCSPKGPPSTTNRLRAKPASFRLKRPIYATRDNMYDWPSSPDDHTPLGKVGESEDGSPDDPWVTDAPLRVPSFEQTEKDLFHPTLGWDEVDDKSPWANFSAGEIEVISDNDQSFFVPKELLSDSTILSQLVSDQQSSLSSPTIKLPDVSNYTLCLWFGLEAGMISASESDNEYKTCYVCEAFAFALKYDRVRLRSTLAPWLRKRFKIVDEADALLLFQTAISIDSVDAAACVIANSYNVLNDSAHDMPMRRCLDPHAMSQETLSTIPLEYLIGLLRSCPADSGITTSKEKICEVARTFEIIVRSEKAKASRKRKAAELEG